MHTPNAHLVSARDGGSVQRGAAQVVLGIDIGTPRQQQAHDVHFPVGAREVEGAVPEVVPGQDQLLHPRRRCSRRSHLPDLLDLLDRRLRLLEDLLGLGQVVIAACLEESRGVSGAPLVRRRHRPGFRRRGRCCRGGRRQLLLRLRLLRLRLLLLRLLLLLLLLLARLIPH